jgi:hypothetical protein
MKLALDAHRRLVSFDDVALRLHDVSRGQARLVAELPIAAPQWLAACADHVAVLTGALAPAGASIHDAELRRFRWDLAPMGTLGLGHVERRGIALSADATRMAYVDWNRCEIVVSDVAGTHLASAGDGGIPSGPSWSPSGAGVVAGSTAQGSGSILFLDVAGAAQGRLAMEQLPEPDPSPGLDDAAFFSVFSARGDLFALSNESWGGRGLFVYETASRQPLWSKVLDSSSEESEDWYPFAIAFASEDELLLVAGPGSIHGYRVRDGADLGAIAVPGDGKGGFAVDQAARKIWIPGPLPTGHAFATGW